MTLKKEELALLARFVGNENMKLQKIGSKRKSRVGIGQFETGEMDFFTHKAQGELPEGFGVLISGRGFHYLRTSPVVKIVEADEKSTTFETEGGIYLLEINNGM